MTFVYHAKIIQILNKKLVYYIRHRTPKYTRIYLRIPRTSHERDAHALDERRAPTDSPLRTAHLIPPRETLGVCPENT